MTENYNFKIWASVVDFWSKFVKKTREAFLEESLKEFPGEFQKEFLQESLNKFLEVSYRASVGIGRSKSWGNPEKNNWNNPGRILKRIPEIIPNETFRRIPESQNGLPKELHQQIKN